MGVLVAVATGTALVHVEIQQKTLYTVLGSPTPWLLVTLPFPLYGIFRYIYLLDQKGEGAAPDETLLRDRPILVTGVLYLVTAVTVLVLVPH